MEPDLSHIKLENRPLAIFDVDDVVLKFIVPYTAYLESMGFNLLPRSFRLFGNIVHETSGELLGETDVKKSIHDFFAAQEEWQTPFELAVDTLAYLAKSSDIVFLTAMPPRFADARRRLLDTFGLSYPLIATEMPKGPIVQRLHANRTMPVFFVDDMVRNHQSVADHMPNAIRLHMTPDSAIHTHAPCAPQDIALPCDWEQMIECFEMRLNQGDRDFL